MNRYTTTKKYNEMLQLAIMRNLEKCLSYFVVHIENEVVRNSIIALLAAVHHEMRKLD